jgi:uncharacterized protein
MFFPDINVLVYAYNLDAPQHSSCARWLETAMNGNAPVCFSWHTIMGLIRIVTTVKMMPKALTAREAMDIADALLSAPVSRMIDPSSGHLAIFRKLVEETGISGARLADAHIAALAIEHGATVVTTDRDYRSFQGLKLIDPLVV